MKVPDRLVATLALIPAILCLALAQSGPDIERATNETRQLLAAGAYADAEREAQRLSAAVAAHQGQDSVAFARVSVLLVQALVSNGRAALPSTLELADRVVQLSTQYAGADALETAQSLHALADVRYERGEFASALLLHERGLSIRERGLAANASEVADSLDRVSAALMQLERFDGARKTLARALAIRSAHADSEPVALARTLELEAWLDRYTAHYADGLATLARAIALRRAHGPNHPDVADASKLHGDLLWFSGDLSTAQAAWAGGLDHVERTLGRDHPATIAFQRRLAVATDRIGNREAARLRRAPALAHAERTLAECNPDLMGLRADLADSLTYTGEYNDARRLYTRALANYRKCVGEVSSRTGTILYNLALLMVEMGDFAEAERLHQRTISIWSSRLGPTHPYVARALDGLAEVALARGDPYRARQLYERALANRRRGGREDPAVAWTLTNLASATADVGNVTLASRYVAEAIAIFQAAGPFDEPDHLARVLALKGQLEMRRGQFAEARASFVEASAIRERTFGRSHPLAAESRAQLARADFGLRSYGPALTGALDAEKTGRDHLQFTVRYLPERQALAYAAKRPRALDLALSIAASGQALATRDVFDAVIRSRAVILDELAARARAAGSASDTASLAAAAVHTRQRYANLVVRSLEEAVPRAMLDEARQQKEDAERALAEGSVEASVEMERSHVGLADVDAALPADAALVSFVAYERLEMLSAGSPRTVRSYGAFVDRAGANGLSFVSLGRASNIDRVIRAWRREASGATPAGPAGADAARAYRIAAAALGGAVWAPLRPHLEGAARVFVVPDGLLSIVNFAALPDRDGRYLVEGPAIVHYLSSERDLAAPARARQGHGVLAVGGAAFGDPSPASAGSSAMRSGCSPVGGMHFTDLPGSRREVYEIGKFWPPQPDGGATILTGRDATETAVKRQLAGRQILHFATHGFFLGADCAPGAIGSRSVGGLTKTTPSKVAGAAAVSATANPLLLAGLAFAGANRRGSIRRDQDDGILTAEEIGGLNLQGTEWAVLSACDTGLGEIRAGEGVFGLRRAFQVAGARTVIMSLWSVEDRSAMEWMGALYEGRMRRGLDTAEAVREASMTVLRQRRARGQSTHPFYWAGFVASGDWR
jgi:CHAT domain-containing protein/tetratricopeptide (TPR) repeat protein